MIKKDTSDATLKLKSAKFYIDFHNEKNNKLFFYEVYSKKKGTAGAERLEYAYMTPDDEVIFYKPIDDIEEHEIPKKDLREFLLGRINSIAMLKLGARVDIKSKSSKPTFKIKALSNEPEVILFASIILGLRPALDFMGIKYSFNKTKEGYKSIKLSTQDGKTKYFNIYANSLYDEYVLNGMSSFIKKIEFTEENLSSKDVFITYFDNRFGKGLFNSYNQKLVSFIDTTTEQILRSYGYSTDPLKLLCITMPKKILNEAVDDIDNLENKRIRMAESIAHSAYNAVSQALVKFKKESKLDNVKLHIQKDYIINNLINTGMVQWSNPVNPLEELTTSAKITKTGVGNPLKEQITIDKRDLNESYFGVVSATHTNEYGGIGLNQTLVNKMMIKDRFGSILIKKFQDTNPFEILSPIESIAPFMDTDDTTRKVMGNQQTSQFIQVKNPDVPLVQTGFEAYIPYIVSDRFAMKAKKPGTVKLEKDYIIMKYNDGSEEIFSTKPTKARTKRGLYIPIEYNVLVKDGQKVKEGEILAATNSLKHGKLGIGKNLVVAEMSYRGMNYEDGWVICEDLKEKYQSSLYEKITIIIPEGAKIQDFNIELNKNTKPGEKLISYVTNATESLEFDEENSITDENTDDLSTGKEIRGNTVTYYSIGGQIADFVIKLNSTKIDKKIIEKFKFQNSEIEKKLKICEKLKNEINKLDCRDNIEHLEALEVGGHKANKMEPEGAIIEVYIETENPIRNGSKFTLASTGGKGTVQYIIDKDKKPYTKETGLEIDFIATPLSIISRKNPSIILQLYLGKVIYFLNKKVEELAKENKISSVRTLITKVFERIDKSDDKVYLNQLKGFLKNKDDFLKKYILKHDPLNNPAFPAIMPPFGSKLSTKDIEDAADILGIPLQEHVIIPEEDNKETKYKVTVGIMPVFYLEHFPKAMSGVRGSINVKNQLTTGQGRAGTKEGNGAIKLGLYDMFSVTSRRANKFIKEMWAVKSDDYEAKKELRKKIIKSAETGEEINVSDIEVKPEDITTKKLIEAYFYGACLQPRF